MSRLRVARTLALCAAAGVLGSACSGADAPSDGSDRTLAPQQQGNHQATPAADGLPGSGSKPTDPVVDPNTSPSGGSEPGALDPTAPSADDPLAGAAGSGAIDPQPGSGPLDGDPGAPIIDIPGIGCGGVANPLAIAPANVDIAGRGAIVEYPCGKHEGAHVVFILNLHGTMPNEGLKFYQQANFSAYRLVAPDASGVSPYNIVVVSPKTVATTGQWGNQDGGADQPYLLDVIDWTYATFAKFQIDHLWVVGHSWGSSYTARFACLPELADKVQGVGLMSGPAALAPGCAERLSILSSCGQNDLPGIVPMDLTPYASMHGCGPRADQPDLGMTKITAWDCPAGTGFVFRNYYWVGIGHQVFPGDWAHEPGIDDMVQSILSVR